MGLTILMDDKKYLNITSDRVLYQGENYVDEFMILIPEKYEDIDLKEFTIALEYADSNSNSFVDILNKDEDLYKDKYIKCTLPITSKITQSAGTIKLQLTLNKVNASTLQQYTLHTSELKLEIHPKSDYYKFSDDSLNKIDQLLGQLDAKIDFLNT